MTIIHKYLCTAWLNSNFTSLAAATSKSTNGETCLFPTHWAMKRADWRRCKKGAGVNVTYWHSLLLSIYHIKIHTQCAIKKNKNSLTRGSYAAVLICFLFRWHRVDERWGSTDIIKNFYFADNGRKISRGSDPLNVGCRWFVSESPAAFVTYTVTQ